MADVNIASMQYDLNGNRVQLKYWLTGEVDDANTTIDYAYDIQNNLISIASKSPSGEPNYTFDADTAGNIDGLGRLIHAVENISYPGQANRSHTLNYAYNMQSCLVDANITDINGGNWIAGYSYKKDGNIQQKVVSSQETEYSYNGDLMTDAGNDSLDWDENGRLTEGLNSLRFEYNWDGKLRDVNDGGGNRLVSLKYDPFGNRVYKASSTQGTRKYIVDIAGGLPTILCEIDPCDPCDPNGSLKKTYVYANSQILVQYDCNGLDDNNEVVIDGKYFYIHDRLGSIRLVVNDLGDVNNSYTYNPYGETFATEVNETTENCFKFTGQWFDSEIGQYYLRARMYDPVLMRFTGRDPVKGKYQNPLTLHSYLYCLNAPTNRIDPTGLWSAKEIVSQGMRKSYLSHTGKVYEQMNSMGGVTGLESMAVLTNLTAQFYEYKGASRTQFVEDLLWMFTERSGPFSRRNGNNLALNFDSTGFASRYQDGYDGQVRHAIGCMAAGYYWGSVGGRVLVAGNEISGTPTSADFELGGAAVDLGVLIDPTSGRMPLNDVGSWMRNNLGE